MKQLPAWVGWSGDRSPPGHDWLPGPILRVTVLTLLYGFLALALTVNYAASAAFFMLAILGMYVGLRRGFANGLTKVERLVMIAFAAYPVVAIASYLLGSQTNVGFRFLGRDLRFLLFIPIYLAIRWSRPRAAHLGWAFLGGALCACILAFLQHQPWPAPTPHGVTGTHITFGDLAILTGFLGAAFLIPDDATSVALSKRGPFIAAAVPISAVGLGITAGVIAVARGGWLAILPLLFLLWWRFAELWNLSRSARFVIGGCVLVLVVLAGLAVPKVRGSAVQAQRNLSAYSAVGNDKSFSAKCVARKPFLKVLLRHSTVSGPGQVQIRRLNVKDRSALHAHGCQGRYGLFLSNVNARHTMLKLSLFRGDGPAVPERQVAIVLAKGRGFLQLWWRGPPVQIKNARNWKKYQVSQDYPLIGPAEIRVPYGEYLWVVPLQGRWGNFAYALSATSIGHRLEMWKAAWFMFVGHPLLGTGTGSFYEMARQFYRKDTSGRLVGDYEHAHNSYLTALATEGTIGLIALLLLLASPLAALAARRPSGVLSHSLLVPAASVSIGVAIFALTESIFVHSFVISWYVVVVVGILALAFSGMVDSSAPFSWR